MSKRLARLAGAALAAVVAVVAGQTPARAATSGGRTLITGVDVSAPRQATALAELGRTPSLINEFFGFVGPTGQPSAFPTRWVDSVVAMGSTPMITWQPNLPTYTTTSVLTSLSNGSQDATIDAWARAAAGVHHRVLIRLMHEFNGDWYPWGNVVAGSTPLAKNQLASNPPAGTYPYTNTGAMYAAAFRHVQARFAAAGATNVAFVWCESRGADQSSVASWYPGDAAVAWLAFDAYNRSASAPLTPEQLYATAYATLTAISSTRPIMIAETATVELPAGGTGPTASKAQWLTDVYTSAVPTLFPRIAAVNWFDDPGSSFAWPFDSSASSLSAMHAVAALPTSDAAVP